MLHLIVANVWDPATENSYKLELIEHIPRVPSCIASGFHLREIRSIEHAQDSLVQACTVVSIGIVYNNSSSINPSINDVLIPLLFFQIQPLVAHKL